MKITKRRVNTVSEVTAKMDALAREASVTNHCYAESAAAGMTEFDALRWRTLCGAATCSAGTRRNGRHRLGS